MEQTTRRTTVVGTFESRDRAERAIEELKRAGFRDDQIGLAMRGQERGVEGTIAEAGETSGGAGTGAITGAGIGAVLGALATGLIPGIGPVIAGGLLAGILGGAAVGAAAGGILGALTGMGIPEEEARYYEQEFRAGRAIVTVRADGRVDEAESVLRRFGAHGVEGSGLGAATTAGQTRTTRPIDPKIESEQTMSLREEELRARTEPMQTGDVTVRKEAITEHRTLDVPVTREEVHVERHPVEPRPAERGDIGTSEEIRVPIREEQVHVEKRPVVKEEVSVSKQPVQETRQVSGDVQREEARVERHGEESTGPSGATRWEEAMPRFRGSWEQRYGTSGRDYWEDWEPRYRYGWEAARDPRYQGRSWSDVEPELRRGWEQDYGSRSAWDEVRDAVREAWESATGTRARR